jgi:drug/metabolite transporter (DMT)-like permease
MKKLLNKSKNKRLVSYFFLLINTVTWGLALIIVKPSLDVTTPFRYLLYRYIIAGFLSIPIVLFYWSKIKGKFGVLKKVLLVEFFGTAVALGLLYLGLDRTSAIEASFISTTTPIFVVLAGIFLLKEKEERHEWIGLFLAFVGTSLLTLFPIILNGMTPVGLSLEGNMLIIAQNIATAIGMILAKKYYKNLPKLFVASLSFYFGAVVFFLLSVLELVGSGSTLSLGTQFLNAVAIDMQYSSVWIAAIYMAIFGSIIGLTAYIKGQDGIEASEASLFWYLQPLVFVPAGIMFLQETIHPIQIISMIIILVGVYIAEKRVRKKRKLLT